MGKLKSKKCKVCKDLYNPFSSTQKVCSQPCALIFTRDQEKRKRELQHKKDKKELRDNDKSYQVKKAQAAFNKYIRTRDHFRPCISCDRHHRGQYHAGHYRTTGANPELRFNPDNCHKQCAPCNNHLSGNLVNYRINLIAKISLERVEVLEGPHEPKRYTIQDLKEIQNYYSKLTKELINDSSYCDKDS